jgi:hypothetical protein
MEQEPRLPSEDAVPDEELASEAVGLAVEHARWHGATFRALRHRNYRLYFTGQAVSLLGSWMQTTALMWLADDLTHQARWPAWIAAAQMIPAFFLGPWGGRRSPPMAQRPNCHGRITQMSQGPAADGDIARS